MPVRSPLFSPIALRIPVRIATALITLAFLAACASDKPDLTGLNASPAASRNGVPFTSVTSEKKVVRVKKYYNVERLRPIYEFDGAPLFIMTSD